MTLHEWGLEHGSDKATAHKYLDFYEARIGEPRNIIEFGVLKGASLKMWRDRYPTAVVSGVDIERKPDIPGVTIFWANASLWYVEPDVLFDLIVDDASHITTEQIATFNLWWPLVAPGGHYVIEDCHTMHYDAYNPTKIDFKAWVESLGIKHEYYCRVPGDESDSMTLIFYKW